MFRPCMIGPCPIVAAGYRRSDLVHEERSVKTKRAA